MSKINYYMGLLLLAICLPLVTGAQNHLYEEKQYVSEGDTLLYRVLWPADFDKSKTYPVVLFLHGAGERGSDNEKQLVHGSKLFLYTRAEYPAIVIFPQCPENDYWASVDIKQVNGKRQFSFPYNSKPTRPMQLVIQLMDSVTQRPFVDTRRCYVGGLSMGGMGTFDILHRRPNMFKAAFPICGGGNSESAMDYAKKVNVWVFHGAKDDIVPPQFSIDMVAALKKYGGNVRFTLYPEANHNSWDSTFAEPGLLQWLFGQHN